jgi:dephospho-CoA kinase
MPAIILLSGEIAAGKSNIATVLERRHGVRRVATGAYLKNVAELRKLAANRDTLKFIGDTLDIETGGKWVSDLALQQSQQSLRDESRSLEAMEYTVAIGFIKLS